MPSNKEKKVRSSIQAAKDFGQLPKYKAPIYDKPQKVDDMYPLKGTGHDNVSTIPILSLNNTKTTDLRALEGPFLLYSVVRTPDDAVKQKETLECP